ncbi:hypothetical protein [Spirochaeta africana]|nr:hypothetical protein [Spirochaeta africana]
MRMILAICGAMLLLGCTGAPPQLDFLELYPLRTMEPDSAVFGWELHSLAKVYDEDGYSNLESFYLINDERYLYWVSERDSWQLVELNNENWIGLGRLVIPAAGDIPGTYRGVLTDASGAQAERSVTLPSPPDDTALQPRMQIADGVIELESEHATHRITVYTAGGRYIAAHDTEERSLPLGRITSQRGELQLFVQTIEPVRGYLFRTGPYRIQRQE